MEQSSEGKESGIAGYIGAGIVGASITGALVLGIKGYSAKSREHEVYSIEQTAEGTLLNKGYANEGLEEKFAETFYPVPDVSGKFASLEYIEKIQKLNQPIRAPPEEGSKESSKNANAYNSEMVNAINRNTRVVNQLSQQVQSHQMSQGAQDDEGELVPIQPSYQKQPSQGTNIDVDVGGWRGSVSDNESCDEPAGPSLAPPEGFPPQRVEPNEFPAQPRR